MILRALEQLRQDPGRPFFGGTLPSIPWSRQKPGLSETPEQLGAPSLGSGIFQTPPNRYPPARPLQLLVEAIPVSWQTIGNTAGKQQPQNRLRGRPPAGSNIEHRTAIV